MAGRKRKLPWNHDFKIPGYGDEPPHVVKPAPETVSVGHSTSAHFECGRCERIKLGKDVAGLDHTPRCEWRGKGDPAVG